MYVNHYCFKLIISNFSADPLSNTQIEFSTREAAISYCKSHGKYQKSLSEIHICSFLMRIFEDLFFLNSLLRVTLVPRCIFSALQVGIMKWRSQHSQKPAQNLMVQTFRGIKEHAYLQNNV